jgi:hypothetical protein
LPTEIVSEVPSTGASQPHKRRARVPVCRRTTLEKAMIAEAVAIKALEVVVGGAVSGIVRTVLSNNRGASDREILVALVRELEKQGFRIGNLNERVIALEVEVQRLATVGSRRVGADSGSHHAIALQAKVYCRDCGAVPGPSSRCVSFSGAHSWLALRSVYCTECGAVPGPSARCVSYSGAHSWAEMRSVYCRVCGAVPGRSTRCRSYSGAHEWADN